MRPLCLLFAFVNEAYFNRIKAVMINMTSGRPMKYFRIRLSGARKRQLLTRYAQFSAYSPYRAKAARYGRHAMTSTETSPRPPVVNLPALSGSGGSQSGPSRVLPPTPRRQRRMPSEDAGTRPKGPTVDWSRGCVSNYTSPRKDRPSCDVLRVIPALVAGTHEHGVDSITSAVAMGRRDEPGDD